MTLQLMKSKEGVSVSLDSIPERELAPMLMALHKTALRELLGRCPWRDLELSARPLHILQRHQIDTIEELLHYTPSRLQSLQGCGRHSCEEIRAALADLGLALRPERGEG